MNNKTLLNSAFVSSEELWRSRRVLSTLSNWPSEDTQPHPIIVNYYIVGKCIVAALLITSSH